MVDILSYPEKGMFNTGQNKTRWKQIKKGIKKASGITFKSAALFFLGTNFVYQIDKNVKDMFPYEEEALIEDKYNINIAYNGPSHEKDRYLFNIAKVLDRESRLGPINVSEITIDSKKFIAKPFHQQVYAIVSNGHSGYYNDIFFPTGHIGLLTPSEYVITHEFKHARMSFIEGQHPEFSEKWEELSKDSSGNSLYYDWFENILSYTFLEDAIPDTLKDDTKNFHIGFITSYARKNINEDVADLCEETIGYPSSLLEKISVYKNEKLRQKVILASEYEMIPKEFMEYWKLYDENYDARKEYLRMESRGESIRRILAYARLDSLDEFIDNHPKSIYVPDARLEKAIWHEYLYQSGDDDDLEKLKRECLEVLKSDYKPRNAYRGALLGMQFYHAENKGKYFDFRVPINEKNVSGKEKLFYDAKKEFDKRELNHNIRLIYEGVNDILKEQGLLK